MCRIIRYYDRNDELYVDEVRLPEIPLIQLQDAFHVSNENPMYDSFPILGEQEIFLKQFLKIDFDFDRFDYFLEFDAPYPERGQIKNL